MQQGEIAKNETNKQRKGEVKGSVRSAPVARGYLHCGYNNKWAESMGKEKRKQNPVREGEKERREKQTAGSSC
jgi:hypothetical protein